MQYGLPFLINAVLTADPNVYQIEMMKHDRDTLTDDFYLPAIEKEHYHILVRLANRQSRRLKTILNLLGIYFRPGIDDDMRDNHALETIDHFDRYTLYLMHETPDAIADGKEPYDITEFVSNLTQDEIQNIIDGYAAASTKHRLTHEELVALDEKAFQLGYELKDFNSWYGSQSFDIRSHSKMKTIRESYYRGVEARVEENKKVNRLCIFIKGEPNQGKTYAAINALSGKKVLSASGGGSGKFDRLTPSTDAIVIDDDVVSANLLNMSDNYMCQTYRRQSNNPYWCGQYFIITSNVSFEEWIKKCHIDKNEHGNAMMSRFYICHIEETWSGKYLLCDSYSDRGSGQEQNDRLERFAKFQDRFNEIIRDYVPSDIDVDYSSITEWQIIKEAYEYENQLQDEIITEYKKEYDEGFSELKLEVDIEEAKQIFEEKTKESRVEIKTMDSTIPKLAYK